MFTRLHQAGSLYPEGLDNLKKAIKWSVFSKYTEHVMQLFLLAHLNIDTYIFIFFFKWTE